MIFYLRAVDSIGWVRGDSIVIGCVRLNEDHNEEGYLVQVIRTEESTFCEVSWFSNAFFAVIGFILNALRYLAKVPFSYIFLATCLYKVASIARVISLGTAKISFAYIFMNMRV
jgi:vacuolar-type H+-ATPase subunit I/STV1